MFVCTVNRNIFSSFSFFFIKQLGHVKDIDLQKFIWGNQTYFEYFKSYLCPPYSCQLDCREIIVICK